MYVALVDSAMTINSRHILPSPSATQNQLRCKQKLCINCKSIQVSFSPPEITFKIQYHSYVSGMQCEFLYVTEGWLLSVEDYTHTHTQIHLHRRTERREGDK